MSDYLNRRMRELENRIGNMDGRPNPHHIKNNDFFYLVPNSNPAVVDNFIKTITGGQIENFACLGQHFEAFAKAYETEMQKPKDELVDKYSKIFRSAKPAPASAPANNGDAPMGQPRYDY